MLDECLWSTSETLYSGGWSTWVCNGLLVARPISGGDLGASVSTGTLASRDIPLSGKTRQSNKNFLPQDLM